MVQVMFGSGIPSTKHSSETLVSGPARTFFSSSFRCTFGGTAKFKVQMYLSGENSNHFHIVYNRSLKKSLTIDDHGDRQIAVDGSSPDPSLTGVGPSILSSHCFNEERVIRHLLQAASSWQKRW